MHISPFSVQGILGCTCFELACYLKKTSHRVKKMISQFNGTSTTRGSYSATTGDNDCNVNSSRYSLRTALCESIWDQAKSEQNVRQDLISRVRYGEIALMHPGHRVKRMDIFDFAVVKHIMGCLWPCNVQGHVRVICCIVSKTAICRMKWTGIWNMGTLLT